MDLEDFKTSKNAGIYAGGVGMVRVGLSGKDRSGGGSECHVTDGRNGLDHIMVNWMRVQVSGRMPSIMSYYLWPKQHLCSS